MPLAGLVVTIAVITLGIVDLALVLWGGPGKSISNFLVKTGLKSPMVVFAFAFTAGHLFGYMAPEDMIPHQGIFPSAITFVVGTGFGYFFGSKK